MYDVIIIGSGPAGLTAAIYTTRANFKTLVVAGEKWGGQLMLTTLVENYPGFPEGIHGPDLMAAMRKQAEHHGAEFVDENAVEFDLKKGGPASPKTRLDLEPKRTASRGGPFKVKAGDKEYESKSIIIATGADTKWLDVPGEKEKIGRGVSTCAPCDAVFFRNKNVIVVGGGDSAMEEANVLTDFAKEVTIVHRREEFRASKIMIERVKKNPKIKFLLNTRILEILGEQKVTGVRLISKIKDQISKIQIKDQKEVTPEELEGKILTTKDQELIWEMQIDGVFVAIGHWPNATIFKNIDKDERGYIKAYDNSKTNIDGVFVAGDVHDQKYQQAVTAAGFGCQAALDVERWLRDKAI